MTALAIPASSIPALAHGGGLNAQGCHNDRKGGTGYHCHRSPGGSSLSVRSRPLGLVSGGSAAFRNCSEARAAGAAPVRVGSPGYGRHLDRDGDGVGCE
ncbi:excalibur calcium-binding domain-containing protein [uncultured Sphingomonas sp.]|uniref:excalibur calcium-binding domain-containing protein n=1 Tax=uncultured Sphingomonas sp. TaxID=158754 RepID=UPI0037485532